MRLLSAIPIASRRFRCTIDTEDQHSPITLFVEITDAEAPHSLEFDEELDRFVEMYPTRAKSLATAVLRATQRGEATPIEF